MDEREMLALQASGKVAAYVGMAMCCLIAVLQIICSDRISYESWMIYFSILSTMFWVKSQKLQVRHERYVALFYTVILFMFTGMFLHQMFGG